MLIRMLGAGGMGAVYEAHDTELDRRVAIKLLRERWSEKGSSSEQIRREAKAMAKLAHPNVVAVYDVGVAEKQPYLTMELIEGITLSAWLGEQPRRWRQVLDVFIRAGRGLAAAHAAGIVHCDFKPENVLIAKTGRVCITDFGVAAGEWEGHPRRITGTPAYMAPEQMSLGPIDSRTDIFAFCVAVFEALYDTRPFTGQTLEALHDAIHSQHVNASVRVGAPSWVHAVLLRGLRAIPEQRYPTMTELLAALNPRVRPLVFGSETRITRATRHEAQRRAL
jgi:serine/threonine protein kinase